MIIDHNRWIDTAASRIIKANQCTMAAGQLKDSSGKMATSSFSITRRNDLWCHQERSSCCTTDLSYIPRYHHHSSDSSHDCSQYQCVSSSSSSILSNSSSSKSSSSHKDHLNMCSKCNPSSKSVHQQHQQNNNCKIKAVCDLNNCRQISVNNTRKSDSILRRNCNTRRNYFIDAGNIVKRIELSKYLDTVKNSRLIVHAIVIMIIFQLFTLPTFVYGLSSSSSISNQTLQHHHMIGSAVGTHTLSSSSSSSSLSSTSSSSSDGLENFKNRDNAIRREPNLSYTNGGCHSCRLREQVKADNLASIKRHILLRLELKTPPNITSPVVPREIIEKFYKNHNMFNRSSTSGSSSSSSSISSSNSNTNSNTGRRSMNSPSYDGMQGDDPRTYIDYTQNSEENESDDYEEEFFSVVNSLYVFPTMPRMRHNRKPDILHFSFTNNGHSSVSQAILHIYIRGRDWIREFESSLLNDNENLPANRQEIILTINRVLRRQNSPNSTHTQKVNEVRQIIPNGLGSWITIDITEMVTNWFNSPNTNHGIVIKTLEPWMKPLVVTDDNPSNKAYALYIEIQTKDNRKRRTKRNTSLNCSESDNEERCCRYPLEVDFRKFDWDWIVAPTSFNAYFCNGECKLGFLPKYPHTHLMQLSTAPQPCCSPTKMSPIKLLYFNNDRNLVMSTIPNMAVDKCSCS